MLWLKHQTVSQVFVRRVFHKAPSLGLSYYYYFALYLHGLPAGLSGTRVTVRLFADDICLYFAHKSIDSVIGELEAALSVLLDWLLSKALVINGSKTELLIVRKPRLVLPDDVRVNYKMISLKPASTVRYLGVIIDQHLTFSDQINALKREYCSQNEILC